MFGRNDPLKKTLSLTLVLALSAGLLAGCGGTGNGGENETRVVNVCSWGEYIDESLIGGLVIHVDDKVIDSSIKTKLANMVKALNQISIS